MNTPAFIFYPALILWSALYGIFGGAFFKLLAVYDSWMAINRFHVLLWKKYPQRSYQKYISGIWAHQIKGKPVELAEYTRLQIERTHPAEPFPLLRLVSNTLLMLFISPFMMMLGMIKGPLYVYRKLLGKRQHMLQTQRLPELADTMQGKEAK